MLPGTTGRMRSSRGNQAGIPNSNVQLRSTPNAQECFPSEAGDHALSFNCEPNALASGREPNDS